MPSRLGLVVAAVASVLAVASACSEMCGNEKLAEYPSPDRRWKIVVFQRDCGATTDFSTQASLLRGEQELGNEGGNLFVADTDHGAAPSGPGGGPDLQVRWEASGGVVITHHPKARVFKAEMDRSGVRVRYDLLK